MGEGADQLLRLVQLFEVLARAASMNVATIINHREY